MTAIALSPDSFPSLAGIVRATWVPIIINPIEGSFDRFVIGVAAANAHGFHVEEANALHKLRCLYGDQAEATIFASVVALEQLAHALASRGAGALLNGSLGVSSVELGAHRVGEGRSLKGIASSWLNVLSSLHRPENVEASDNDGADDGRGADGIDKLPRLVMDYVRREEPSFARFFRQDLIGGQRRHKSHEVTIDFSGSKLVANFGLLQPGGVAKSVDHIKRRLWDLKVDRDKEAGALIGRSHEMIVQMPSADDPIFTPRQHARLRDAHHALEEQADQEELRLRPLPSVPLIARRVIEAERTTPQPG